MKIFLALGLLQVLSHPATGFLPTSSTHPSLSQPTPTDHRISIPIRRSRIGQRKTQNFLLGVTSTSQDSSSSSGAATTPLEANANEEAEAPRLAVQKTFCVTGVVSKTGPLNEAVARIAKLDSLGDANDLIGIGAVWARMDALTEDDVLRQYDNDSDFDANARSQYADLKNYKHGTYEDTYGSNDSDDGEEDLESYIEQMDQQRFRRVLSPTLIEAGTDLRIYPNPRRFPAAAEFGKLDKNGKSSRLIYEDTTFVVVDKPPMLPTQPDASNYYENCPGSVQEYMGPFDDIAGDRIARPLLCHRVDACVGGCVVLSKDANGQKVFQEFQRDRKLRKMYKAVTRKPVPLGMHLHFMWAPQNARGKSVGPPCQLVSHTPPESRRKARVRSFVCCNIVLCWQLYCSSLQFDLFMKLITAVRLMPYFCFSIHSTSLLLLHRNFGFGVCWRLRKVKRFALKERATWWKMESIIKTQSAW